MQREGDRLQGEFAGLDFGEVQNIVEDPQQRLCGRPGQGQVFPLLGGEVGVQQKVRHAQDAVHGRADFVAHVGEELTLGTIGRFCGYAGLDLRRLRLAANLHLLGERLERIFQRGRSVPHQVFEPLLVQLQLSDLGLQGLFLALQRVYHRVEGLGKVPHEGDALVVVPPGNLLCLPGEVHQPRVQFLEGRRQEVLALRQLFAQLPLRQGDDELAHLSYTFAERVDQFRVTLRVRVDVAGRVEWFGRPPPEQFRQDFTGVL